MTIDPQKVSALIAEIAETEITARFGKLAPHEIRQKSGPSDLVTEVDEATEVKLRAALADIRPDATFIGEELAAKNPASVEALAGDGAFWVVDPLDGAPTPRERLIALRSLGWLRPVARQEALRGRLAENFDSRPGHCSAYAYLHLAMGDVDFKISSRIHPWDHLAGALLVSEAGGKVAFLDDGETYGPSPSIDKALLAAGPGRDWSAIARQLRG